LNISDYVIDLDKEYKFVGGNGEVELWRKVESDEVAAVKSYKVKRCKGNNEDIEETFVRKVGLLFTLKYLFIFSLKGYCLPKGNKGAKLITKYMVNGSLKSIIVLGWWTVYNAVTFQ
jgi:hypothetical protein